MGRSIKGLVALVVAAISQLDLDQTVTLTWGQVELQAVDRAIINPNLEPRVFAAKGDPCHCKEPRMVRVFSGQG